MAHLGGFQPPLQHTPQPQVNDQAGLLRAQIIRESRQNARNKARTPYYTAPDYPGTAAYNLNANLSELPLSQKRKRANAREEKLPNPEAPIVPEVILEAVNWTPEEHHDHMMQEFEALEKASRSNSPAQSSLQSDSNLDFPSSNSSIQDPVCTSMFKLSDSETHQDICTAFSPTGAELPQQDIKRPKLRPLPITRPSRQPLAQNSPTASQPSDSVSGIDVPFLKEPATRLISEQQLIDEVKGIYAGLVMVEKKCVEIVKQQSQATRRLEDQQWKALVALHRTLLQEHHDFFSASQHPTASEPLKKLAIKYAMPARMWRLGIRPALEMLRSSRSEMDLDLALYVYHAYAMLSSLQTEFPEDAFQWGSIKYNLREYFQALKADGMNIPSPFFDNWERKQPRCNCEFCERYAPFGNHFFGDEDEEFLASYIDSHSYREHVTTDGTSKAPYLNLGDTALRLMSGWLHYGRKIATDFQSFTSAFIFLGLVGAAAGLNN